MMLERQNSEIFLVSYFINFCEFSIFGLFYVYCSFKFLTLTCKNAIVVLDWSILYVIIVLFTSVLGIGVIVWGIFCVCRR